ncbi:hypothetical protein AtEden1_Chr1g0040851 [Arabidopsis thaliana]
MVEQQRNLDGQGGRAKERRFFFFLAIVAFSFVIVRPADGDKLGFGDLMPKKSPFYCRKDKYTHF